MEEVDLLKNLPKNAEIDIKPDVLTPEYALRMEKPAQAGDPAGTSLQPIIGPDIKADLPELGHADRASSRRHRATGRRSRRGESRYLRPDPAGRTVDPQRRRGTRRKRRLDGVTTLDAMLACPPTR